MDSSSKRSGDGTEIRKVRIGELLRIRYMSTCAKTESGKCSRMGSFMTQTRSSRKLRHGKPRWLIQVQSFLFCFAQIWQLICDQDLRCSFHRTLRCSRCPLAKLQLSPIFHSVLLKLDCSAIPVRHRQAHMDNNLRLVYGTVSLVLQRQAGKVMRLL